MSKKLTLNILKNIDCNGGMIGSELSDLQKQIYNSVGEYFDVLCVALRKKPLAALDFSAYGKRKHRKRNVKLINEIIDFANEKNIKVLHLKKDERYYLKTIFYYPHQKNNAYKLAYVLWYENNKFQIPFTNLQRPYIEGILLGYSTHNIKQFYLHNYKIKLSDEDDKFIRKLVKELKNYKEWVDDNIEKKNIQPIDYIEQL